MVERRVMDLLRGLTAVVYGVRQARGTAMRKPAMRSAATRWPG